MVEEVGGLCAELAGLAHRRGCHTWMHICHKVFNNAFVPEGSGMKFRFKFLLKNPLTDPWRHFLLVINSKEHCEKHI